MENASKALVMAAGVLISVIIISTLLYAASYWGIIPQAKDESDKVKQLAQYNMQFESYNRQLIYGADLISLLNKAIDNNDKYNAGEEDLSYINIVFTLNTDVEYTKTRYNTYLNQQQQVLSNLPIEYFPESQNSENPETVLEKDVTYNMNDMNVRKLLENINTQSSRTKEKTDRFDDPREGIDYYNKVYYCKWYVKTRYASTYFKTRAFACTETKYKDGKIYYMKFAEQNVIDENEIIY